jgi:hypothetical protein
MASSSKKRTYCKTSVEREWVSTLIVLMLVDSLCSHSLSSRDNHCKYSGFPADDMPDWQYTYSTNGWTSSQHGVNWLKRIFIPETAPKSTAEARMLICDGHGSHATTEFMWAAFCANIHLVFLLPHCSHVLQPLDVNFFGIL